MKSTQSIATALLVGLVSVGIATGQESTVERQGRYTIEKVQATYQVNPGGTLYLSASAGAIIVESTDKNEVHVLAEKRVDEDREDRARELLDEIEVEMTQSGDDVRVEARIYRSRRNRRVPLRFRVSVPRRYNIDLDTEGGEIEIADLDGNVMARTSGGGIEVGRITGQVEVRTAGGSIEIEEGGSRVIAKTAGGGIKIRRSAGSVEANTAGGSIELGPSGGDVELKTAGGSIRIEESGGRVRAETAGGSISVDGSNGPVDVRTAGGSLRIENARGAIEAHTSGGSIEAELVVSDSGTDTSCNLETAGGDVTIHLPENLAATIDAEIRVRDNDSGWGRRDYEILSDFDIPVEEDSGKDDDRRWRDDSRVTARGDINGGGDRIKLSTANGDIHILKLRQ
jgi:DUF4097 and DUF4098 domain-containing protein YvlB